MGARELRKYQERAISSLRELSEERLKAVVDFIEYLQSKEEWEATWEVLGDEKMMADIRAADEDWEAGRRGNFIPWDKVKRNA